MEGRRQPLTSPAGDGRQAAADDTRSVRDLLRSFGAESGRLVREELRLVRAEMGEKADVFKRNLGKLIVGGVMMAAAALILLTAVNRGLTVLFAQFMPAAIAIWVAPLVLAAVLGLWGRSLMKRAQDSLKQEGVAPRQTVDSLREHKAWAAEEIQEMHHG